MKKRLQVGVVLVALLSFLTVSASAYDVNDIYNQVLAIRNELGYPTGNWSSLRRAINYIADNMPKSYDYSTVLSNIKTNSDSLVTYIKLIEGDTNSISSRATELVNKLNDVYVRQGQMQVAITNAISSASALNHSDLTAFADANHTDLTEFKDANHTDLTAFKTANHTDLYSLISTFYRYPSFNSYQGSSTPYVAHLSGGSGRYYYSWGYIVSAVTDFLTYDGTYNGTDTLYKRISKLQQVLASDDDLALKKANQENEKTVTSDFVNGSSSKTSLGTSDLGNLKDIGGSFNDLASLNGQSSVGSFTSGLSSADGVGQGWFSEATRASLDAVTPASVSTLSADGAPADPYNMSGFTDNYNWLWGDAS